MDWIWSSRCLELLCTSPQCSNLKGVSVGGINSPRHPKSRWLTATKKGSVRWTDAVLFLGVSVDATVLMLYTDNASVHQVLKASQPKRLRMLLRDRRIDRHFLLTKESVHPKLKRLSWRVSVLILTERQIDRRCPLSDRWIFWCYCLRCSSSAIHPAHLEIAPSVHPMVPCFHPVYQLIRPLHRRFLSRYHWFIRRCPFFSFLCSVLTLKNRLYSQFGMWYFCILAT
jgi:hypothetical protein